MSAEATGWVYRYSPLVGVAFQVHHALADSANDQNGMELWMRQKVMAAKARTTRGTVNTALARMLNVCRAGAGDEPVEGGCTLLTIPSCPVCGGSGVGPEPWPPLLTLLEEGTGGANRYRLELPDGLPVVYETRRRGVSAQPTPPAQPRARAGRAGVSRERTGGARSRDTEPKGQPKLIPTPPGEGAPDAPQTVAEQQKAAAHAIATEVFDKATPKPAQPFVGVMAVAKALVRAGHDPDRIVAAMLAVPTISIGWCEGQINGKSRNGVTARPPTAKREAPAGRVR